MSLQTEAQSVLSALAQALKLPTDTPLALNSEGEAVLSVNSAFLITFWLDEATSSLLLNVPVGAVPSGPETTEVLFELLCANYSFNLTGGATLGIDRANGLVTLSQSVPLPLQPVTRIVSIVESLADVTLHWRRQIPALAVGWETSDATDVAGGAGIRV